MAIACFPQWCRYGYRRGRLEWSWRCVPWKNLSEVQRLLVVQYLEKQLSAILKSDSMTYRVASRRPARTGVMSAGTETFVQQLEQGSFWTNWRRARFDAVTPVPARRLITVVKAMSRLLPRPPFLLCFSGQGWTLCVAEPEYENSRCLANLGNMLIEPDISENLDKHLDFLLDDWLVLRSVWDPATVNSGLHGHRPKQQSGFDLGFEKAMASDCRWLKVKTIVQKPVMNSMSAWLDRCYLSYKCWWICTYIQLSVISILVEGYHFAPILSVRIWAFNNIYHVVLSVLNKNQSQEESVNYWDELWNKWIIILVFKNLSDPSLASTQNSNCERGKIWNVSNLPRLILIYTFQTIVWGATSKKLTKRGTCWKNRCNEYLYGVIKFPPVYTYAPQQETVSAIFYCCNWSGLAAIQLRI